MSVDSTKKWQRNIRVPDELWNYVRSLAKNGNCSAVVIKLIKTHRKHHDASIFSWSKRGKLRSTEAIAQNGNKTQVDGSHT